VSKLPLSRSENDPPSGANSAALVSALSGIMIYTLGADSWMPLCRLLTGTIVILIVIVIFRQVGLIAR
jgi:hypothetical protein